MRHSTSVLTSNTSAKLQLHDYRDAVGKLAQPSGDLLRAKLRAYSETLKTTKELTRPLPTHEERGPEEDRALVTAGQSVSAGGGTRPHTPLRTADFESAQARRTTASPSGVYRKSNTPRFAGCSVLGHIRDALTLLDGGCSAAEVAGAIALLESDDHQAVQDARQLLQVAQSAGDPSAFIEGAKALLRRLLDDHQRRSASGA